MTVPTPPPDAFAPVTPPDGQAGAPHPDAPVADRRGAWCR